MQSRSIQDSAPQTKLLPQNPLNEPESQVVTAHGFRFELKGCQISGQVSGQVSGQASGPAAESRITCHLLIQNLARTDRPLHLQAYQYPTHSRLISPTGEEFHTDRIQFGQKSHPKQVTAQLVSQVPLKASVSFTAKPIHQAKLIEVIYSFTELKYGMTLEKTLRFNNIQLTPPSPTIQKPLAQQRIHIKQINIALQSPQP
jgi:hypothetical protein